MRGGIWVLNIMAFVWAAAGLYLTSHPLWWLVVPAAVSAALLVWAQRALREVSPPATGEHVGRVVGIWSAIEGVAIFVTANVLINMHRPDAVMPAIAIIVGLHFFGLAKGIPVRLYYATGAALVVTGIVALVAPPWHVPLALGVTAAVILWVSGIALVRSAL
jgi:hypothetical protein